MACGWPAPPSPLPQAGEVEGSERVPRHADRLADAEQHGIRVLDDLGIPHPQHPPALVGQESVATAVGGAVRMLAAIELDDEPVRRTGEVGDVRSERDLVPELDSA